MIARKLTHNEISDGFLLCPCGKFAHVMKAEVLTRLPDGYTGELCPECSTWMCSVDILRQAGYDIPQK